jgi:hypothetical protein
VLELGMKLDYETKQIIAEEREQLEADNWHRVSNDNGNYYASVRYKAGGILRDRQR